MDAERWKRVEQVYHDVLAFPMTERAAALERLCAGDRALRNEVDSLLQARDEAGAFLSAADSRSPMAQLNSERDLAGESLGHYHLIASIGAGAMGEVYRARDSRLDRNVALKILPAQFTRDRERVARFQREARLASALNHPNIITIYDIGQIGETWYMAAEFVEGVTIRVRLNAGKLELPEALGIAIQCARALGTAHQAGIIHRDIKPENIMLRHDGVVKVVDFGLARIAGPGIEFAADATQSGALIGTPRYMSPEQARVQKLDGRSDIFSLGAVLFEMVAGKPAIPGESTADVFAALLGSDRPAASEFAGPACAPLDAILSQALQSDLEKRYRTMEELAADLQNLKDAIEQGTAFSKLPPIAAAPPSARESPISRRALAGGLVSVGGLGIAAYFLTRTPGARQEFPASSVVPLTSFGGYKDFGSFSPDGNRIAFSWNGGKGEKPERNIYTKTIGQDEPVRLTFGSDDDRLPVWSPNGDQIAFCRRLQGNRYGVFVVPSAGGAERKIAEGGFGVSWSPDGKTLATAGLLSNGGSLFLVDIASGKQRPLTNPSPYLDSLPVFSPDGKWIAFTRQFGFAAREIFVIPSGGGTERQLTFDREPTYGAAWTKDCSEIVFSSNRGRGGESLWRVSASGGTPKRLLENAPGGSFYPAISRQGNRLVYTVSFKDTNLYAYEGPGFQGRPMPAHFSGPKALILSSRRDDSPNISPSGELIAFVSKRTGNEEIWICDRNGGAPRQLTSFNGPGTGTPRWSPDGASIAFDSLVSGNPDIYLMRAEGGKPRRLTTGPHTNFMPSWSTDGEWIFFKSDRAGADQIWKIPAAGGDPVQVTRNGATEAFASPDGKFLFFTKRGFGPLWKTSVDGGVEEPVSELKAFDRIYRSWGVLAEGIYFISREEGARQTIRFFSFATRQVRPLAVLDREPVWDYPDVALSRDGSRLIYASLDQEVDDLMSIENFH